MTPPPCVQETQDAMQDLEHEKNVLKRQLVKLSKKYQAATGGSPSADSLVLEESPSAGG